MRRRNERRNHLPFTIRHIAWIAKASAVMFSSGDISPGHRGLLRIINNPMESHPTDITQQLLKRALSGAVNFCSGFKNPLRADGGFQGYCRHFLRLPPLPQWGIFPLNRRPRRRRLCAISGCAELTSGMPEVDGIAEAQAKARGSPNSQQRTNMTSNRSHARLGTARAPGQYSSRIVRRMLAAVAQGSAVFTSARARSTYRKRIAFRSLTTHIAAGKLAFN